MKAPFRMYEYGSSSRGTIFIFGGWRSSRLMYMPGIRTFNKLGWRCILFMPHTKLIAVGTPYQALIDAGEWADAAVNTYIAGTKKGHTYMSMGISLGTMFASEIAKRHTEINRLVMTAPFGDFAEHVGLWQGHWYFGRVLKSQPTNVIESAIILNQFSTTARLERLTDKQIMILRSQHDTVTHTQVAKAFVEKLVAVNPRTIVNTVPGGHYVGIFRNYLWLTKDKRQRSFFELP